MKGLHNSKLIHANANIRKSLANTIFLAKIVNVSHANISLH
jgi:hypothetical protein